MALARVWRRGRKPEADIPSALCASSSRRRSTTPTAGRTSAPRSRRSAADVQARFAPDEGVDVHFLMGNDENTHQGLPAGRANSSSTRTPTSTTWPGSSRKSGAPRDLVRRLHPDQRGAPSRRLPQVHPGVSTTPATSTKAYRGLYCTGCEAFKTEKEVADGRCPEPSDAAQLDSRGELLLPPLGYRDRSVAHYEAQPRLHPAGEPAERDRQPRRGRARGRLHQPGGAFLGDPRPVRPGADDLRLVRRAPELHPGASATAPTTSRSRSCWPADVHVIGKDITRFHCASGRRC